MQEWDVTPLSHGSTWVRADFHLHIKADKEFKFSGHDSDFVNEYVARLKQAAIRIGLITNHNKFNYYEFKNLRKKAKKEGICLLPGVELSVNDGANGVHTLVAFSDQWLEGGQNYIDQFLNATFAGKAPAQYEQENGRCNHNLLVTLSNLEEYHKDFFIVFAHVEAPSGLWKEIQGGRMEELGKQPLIQKHCKAFQKVKTHDKPDGPCRTKIQQWWSEYYPAEVEGCDAKSLDDIGRGKSAYLKIGELSYDAVKYALTDCDFRVAKELVQPQHSFVKSIRFEGGLLDGKGLDLSPHLNCLIGIRGSGKSAILESLRYALDIPSGQKSQDQDYKKALLSFLLKSGGKVIVEAVDRHGTNYEIHRILGEQPNIYVNGDLCPGLSVRGTIITKPLYFGQKDLSATGEGFGHDLVDKLLGEQLTLIRQEIREHAEMLQASVEALQKIFEDNDQRKENEAELKEVNFKLRQFEKHGVEDKLSKRVAFDQDISFCSKIDNGIMAWASALNGTFETIEDLLEDIKKYETKYNQEFLTRYKTKCLRLSKATRVVRTASACADKTSKELALLRKELESSKESLKDEFAEVERALVKSLEEQGVKSIQPDDYLVLTRKQASLAETIESLVKKTERLEGAETELLSKLTQLNNAWHAEFKSISKALKTINEAQDALKVKIEFKGDKEAFATKMEETFRGNSIRKGCYQALAEKYQDFGAIYIDLDNAAKEMKGKAEIMKELFLKNLSDLLSFQVPNSYEITYHGKPLKSHSLGQRASAMMLFILSQKENDLLLIDQPEDDLDNQTIYEDVVKLLRTLKCDQQFIFATHNANFPVLGDAENIYACSFADDKITVKSGSIDNKDMQKKIVAIMEGGKEAFDRRKMIYQIWKA